MPTWPFARNDADKNMLYRPLPLTGCHLSQELRRAVPVHDNSGDLLSFPP